MVAQRDDDAAQQKSGPSLLRGITDAAVLTEVFARGRVTRAELATVTSFSKPTISQSVARLEQAGLLAQTGVAAGRRGRVATFYDLAAGAGCVLAGQLDQLGIRLRTADLAGRVLADTHHRLPGRPGADPLASITRAVRAHVGGLDASPPLRAAAFSVANPVDPGSGAVVRMADSPFPAGESLSRARLARALGTEVLLDNDVTYAATAEHTVGIARDEPTFAYLYVGAGIGMATLVDGIPIRGSRGLAGEVGALRCPTATGVTSLTRAYRQSGFAAADLPSIDVSAAVDALTSDAAGADRRVLALADVVAFGISAACAVVDPGLVVLGGPIGSRPEFLDPVASAVAGLVSSVVPRIETSALTDRPVLSGAIGHALARGREMVAQSSAPRAAAAPAPAIRSK